MAEVLRVDFETRSAVDLNRRGVYVYAEDPSTEVLCMAYAFGDEPVSLWVPPEPGDDCGVFSGYRRLAAHILRGAPLHAWNAQFERIIWRGILGPRYGFPVPRLEQWHCTAADAAALALPRKLETAALALGLETLKDAEGHRLMMRMCKPRKPKKRDGEVEGRVYWHDSPEMRVRLGEYCVRDVETERAVAARIRPIGASERQVYLFNQIVNDRGVRVDLELVDAMRDVAEVATARGNREIDELTEGAVAGVTKVPDLTRWLQAQGVDLADVKKSTLRDLDLTDVGDVERRVIEIRQEVAKSSVSKLKSARGATCADGRARGMFLYHGSSTGRETGKLIQLNNLPRVTVKGVEKYIPLVVKRRVTKIATVEPPMLVVSSMLRSMLTATPGNILRAGDYEQIEARVVAWFAEQDDLLQLFASGGKVYETMAAYIQTRKLGREVLASEIENPSEQRTLGKNTILGCGFQMGADTFRTQAKLQGGVDISEADAALAVNGYRELYPRIPAFWKAINSAAIRAVRRPGSVETCGRNDSIQFSVRGQFLWCVLPSGRPLAYARPTVEERVVRPKTGEPFVTRGVSHMGMSQYSRKWSRQHLYGGKLTENVVQAAARDLMITAARRLEAAGYPVVMTVYDEIITDCERDSGSLAEFKTLTAETPRWADGLPVSVGAWEGERYKK